LRHFEFALRIGTRSLSAFIHTAFQVAASPIRRGSKRIDLLFGVLVEPHDRIGDQGGCNVAS
jgi:hypothetical protein